MTSAITRYVTAVVATALVATTAVGVYAGMPASEEIRAAVFFGSLTLATLLLRYEGSKSGASGSISFLPALSLAVVAPTFAAPLVIAFAQLVAESVVKRPRIRVVFNLSQMAIATSAACVAVLLSRSLSSYWTGHLVLGLVGATVLFHLINTALVAGAIAIESNKRLSDVWVSGALRTLPYDIMAVPVVYLLVWAYQEKGAATVMLFVVPVLGLRQIYKQNWELERANEELLEVMVKAIEARDPYTSGHSIRVARYAIEIGRLTKLDSRTLESLRISAMLHDVGKIHQEYAGVLQKQDRLTDDEMRLMESHPIRSAELVGKVSKLRYLLPAIRAHHERWDGRGYPDQLAGSQIPLLARYIAIADTVDAMTSSRPYRSALPISVVKKEVTAGIGRQFDPEIASVLLRPANWARFEALILDSHLQPIGESGAGGEGEPAIAPGARA
jgi:HD-GYP domain-containing protein (c-di-GMP phosphodiesterase class II)